MRTRVFAEEYETQKHAEEHAALQELSLSLQRANVALMLLGATEVSADRKQLARVCSGQLLSATNTLASILSLTEKLSPKVKEAIALSRIFYETLLVASFTCSGGYERARRAELYSIYRIFRSQTKVQNASGFTLKVSRTARLSRKDPQVCAALETFGGKPGIRPCFTETRAEMLTQLAAADATVGLYFGGVEGMIHDFSSEIIHGSFHGHVLFDSVQTGKDETIDNLSAHHEMVMFAVSLSVAATSRVIGKSFEMESVTGKLERSCITSLLPYVPDEMACQLREVYSE